MKSPLFLLVAVLALAGLFALAFWETNSAGSLESVAASPAAAGVAKPSGLLIPSPAEIDMGTVPQRGRKESSFTLTNPTNESVEIGPMDSSCPCLEIQLPKKILSPAETLSARILLDLAEEPNFVGRLLMTVKAKTPAGERAFEVECRVAVARTAN